MLTSYVLRPMADHDDHDHDHSHPHRDPPSFPIQERRAIWGFVLAFFVYWVSHAFVYVENDPAALAKASARGEKVMWTSFDKHYRQTPASFLQPATQAELRAILAEAAQHNTTVKVVGSGHSWSPIGLTDGIMLNLDLFNKVLSIDAQAMRVTVQAGIRIRALSAALAAHDPPLALRNTGVLNRQSLAGALATGTHGTGMDYPIMSADVVALELVTAAGQVLRVSRADPDPAMREVFEAATISLGGLGVVTEVTMEVVEAFSVVKRSRLLPLTTVLETLPQLATSIEHLLIWWMPYTETAQLLEANRTARATTLPLAAGEEPLSSLSALVASFLLPLRPWLGVVQMRTLCAAAWFSSLFPVTWVPRMNRYLVAPALHMFAGGGVAFYAEGYKGVVLATHPDAYREAEWFLPLESFPAAFAAFQAFLETHKGQVGANFVVQLRMTKADNLWLSPFRGTAPWYVSVATLVKGFDCEAYFQAVEEEVWLPHGAKPHWGKLHNLRYEELSAMYGEEYEKFLAVRRRLDPTDTFLNKHLMDMLVPRALK